jgi:methyl-accepting chemotaxis protein
MRIRTRFVLAFILLQFVGLLGVSALFYTVLRETVTERVESEAQAMVGSIARMIDLYFSTTVAHPDRRHTYMELRKRILEQRIGSHGYYFVIDAGSGEVVIHPDEEVEETLLVDSAPFAEYLLEHYRGSPEERMVRYRSPESGEWRRVVFEYDAQAGWIVASSARETEMFAPLQAALRQLALLGSAVVLVSIALGGLIAGRFLRPLQQLSQGIRTVAQGDFSISLRDGAERRRDELTELLREVDTSLLARLNELVHRVRVISSDGQLLNETLSRDVESGVANTRTLRTQALRLGEELNDLLRRIERLQTEIREVEGVAQTLTEDAEKQRAASEAVGESVASMSISLEKVREIGSRRAATLAGLDSRMKESRSTQAGLHRAIEALRSEATEILTVNNLIADVSEQTHLLAVNTAIEAARISSGGIQAAGRVAGQAAGDGGHGFNVVAQEMRDLSARSSKGAETIEELVSNLQKDIQSIAGWSGRAEETFEEALKETDTFLEAMQRILDESVRIAEESDRIREHASPLSAMGASLIDRAGRLNGAIRELRRTTVESATVLRESMETFTEISERTESVELSQRRVELLARWSQENIDELHTFTGEFQIREEEGEERSPLDPETVSQRATEALREKDSPDAEELPSVS